MRTLIQVAEKAGRPASGYRVYLGQALAAQGAAPPAIDELNRALADPQLPTEQRKFASELLGQIKSRSGL